VLTAWAEVYRQPAPDALAAAATPPTGTVPRP
jgi:hypothetical protein